MVKIHINFTNKWLYTFALIIGIFALGAGVYAFTLDGSGVPSVMGHSADEIEGGGGLWTLSGSDIYYNTGDVGIDTASPSTTLDVNGTVLADSFVGDGSGLTNLVVKVTGVGTCDSNNDGLLRYRSGLCTDDFRNSYFDICMRQGDTIYSWKNIQNNSWADDTCNQDGCPSGQEWYQCTGWIIEPGCYPVEPPMSCYCEGPEIICPE